MYKILFSLVLGFLACAANLQAQQVICGHELAIEQLEQQFPGYKTALNQTFEEAKRLGAINRISRAAAVYTIPVVVHVVWNTEEENIPDSLIESQIAVLNEDFRRLNPDAGNVREQFAGVVGDPMIEFDLVSIERVQTSALFEVDLLTNALPDAVKITAQGGSDAWDTRTHLNLWICQIQPISLGGIPLGQVLGFAYPPVGLDNWPAGVNAPSEALEGVVIDYRVIGRNNPFSVDVGLGEPLETQGRTATHEIGHYLGLRHIWGDGGGIFGGDSCGEDDGVADTPNTASQANFDCDTSRNTCNDGVDDQVDMIENYMDYAAESCMNSFTNGQIDIIRGVLEGVRCELVGACMDTATEQIDLSSKLKLAPNPTTGMVFFETSLVDLSTYKAQLFTLSGKTLPVSVDFDAQSINLADVANGLYILKLQKGTKQLIKKISVLR